MKKYFPIYKSHEAAKKLGCFNCKTDCTNQKHLDSGYPTGKYMFTCPKCGMATYYDIDLK